MLTFEEIKEWFSKLFSSNTEVSFNKFLALLLFIDCSVLAFLQYYPELVVVVGAMLTVLGFKNTKEYLSEKATKK